MYTLVYHVRETKETKGLPEVFEREYRGEEVRLRRNALHYLYDTVQSEYRERGYATEVRVGSLYCYKSEKTAEGNREELRY